MRRDPGVCVAAGADSHGHAQARRRSSRQTDKMSRGTRGSTDIGCEQLEGSGRGRTCMVAGCLRRRRRRKGWTRLSRERKSRRVLSAFKCRMSGASGLARGTDERIAASGVWRLASGVHAEAIVHAPTPPSLSPPTRARHLLGHSDT
jgi:hypothetical protein